MPCFVDRRLPVDEQNKPNRKEQLHTLTGQRGRIAIALGRMARGGWGHYKVKAHKKLGQVKSCFGLLWVVLDIGAAGRLKGKQEKTTKPKKWPPFLKRLQTGQVEEDL